MIQESDEDLPLISLDPASTVYSSIQKAEAVIKELRVY